MQMQKIGKRGAVGAGAIVGAILFVGLMIGGLMFWNFQSTAEAEEQPQPPKVGSDSNFCANNPSPNVKVRAKDSERATARYGDVLLALKDVDSGSVVTETLGNSAAYEASTDTPLTCLHSYDVFVLTNNNTGVNGKYVGRYKADRNPVEIDLVFTNSSATPQARIYDLDAAGYLYEAAPNDAAPAGTFLNLNSSGTYWRSNTNATDITVAADGELRLRLDLQGSAADTKFGIKSLLAWDNSDDTNTDDWATPIFSVNGVELSDVKGSLPSDSQLGLSGYELVYDLGFAVDEVVRSVQIQQKSGAGVNPDMDLRFRIAGTGIIQSNKDPNVLVGGIIDESAPAKLNTYVAFSDASSREQVVSASGAHIGIITIT